MCQLCTIARVTQKLKSRSQDIQNTTQFSTAILKNKILNSSNQK